MVYKGKKSNFDLKTKLRFNVSQYKNHYCKKGNLYLFDSSKFSTYGNDYVTIYSGCKIDVHKNALLEIGGGTHINENCRIGAKEYIHIGQNCLIGDEVSIHDFDGHKIFGNEGISKVFIGDNVWLGERVTILKGVKIGNASIIGACSVVTKDIPDNCIAVGNPAKVIKNNVKWSK